MKFEGAELPDEFPVEKPEEIADRDFSRVIVYVIEDLGNIRLGKKATTHGSEFCSSCPRCTRTFQETGVMPGGGRNEDRFLVWPYRPIRRQKLTPEQQAEIQGKPFDPFDDRGAFKPVFMCRKCRRDNDKPWTGDLIEYIKEMLEISFIEACQYLVEVLQRMESMTPGQAWAVVNPQGRLEPTLTPRLRSAQRPKQTWEEVAKGIVLQAVQDLHGPLGEDARWYLAEVRHLEEKMIRRGRLGYIPADRWIDDANVGKFLVPQGILIPEYHINKITGEEELWGLSVRRPPDVVEAEKAAGKRGNKYHQVKGSNPALYGSFTIKEDQPLMIVESQFDCLLTWQLVGPDISCVATQGVSGARTVEAISEVDQASLILVAMDPDAAGEGGAEFWLECFDKNAIIWRDQAGDLTEMVTAGLDVQAWIYEGIVACEEMIFNETQEATESSPEALDAEEDDTLPDLEEIPQILTTEALETQFVEEEDDTLPDLEEHLCVRCGTPGKYQDGLGHWWCGEHVAGYQLMELGGLKRIRYSDFYYEAGPAAISFHPPEMVELKEGGRVTGGVDGYLQFACECPIERVWKAASELHWKVSSLYVKPKEKLRATYIEHPCARYGCHFDTRRPVALHADGRFEHGVVTWKKTPHQLEWCPRCTMCNVLLHRLERLGFPGSRPGYAGVKLEPGRENAIQWVREASILEVCFMFDHMRKAVQQEPIELAKAG